MSMGGKTTTTQTVDDNTQKYQDVVRQRAQSIANSGNPAYAGPLTVAPNDAMTAAQAGYQRAASYSPLAFSQGAIQQFMDPYQQDVIDASNADYQHLADGAINTINANATAAGAFGSRADVARGAALGQLGRGQAAQLAALRSTGYQNAVNQFNQMNAAGLQGQYANLAGAGGLLNVGQSLAGLQGQNNANLYAEWQRQQGVPYQQLQGLESAIGPYGTTQTAQKTPGLLPTLIGLGSIAAAPFTGGMSLAGPTVLGAGSNAPPGDYEGG